jgi:ribonucleoside-triphosphate reductase
MQNSLNKEGNIVEFSSNRATAGVATDVMHGSASPNKEFISQVAQLQAQQIKPVKLEHIYVVKKDGTREEFDNKKIINAISKSATRVLVKLSDDEIQNICNFLDNNIARMGKSEITIAEMHNLVEGALEALNPAVAQSYRNYRNYKQDFVHMLDKVYQESQRIMYIGDKENSNADSALVSTKRSLIFNQLNKELYKKFFLTVPELQAIRDGYIYIHDMSARRDTMNCCLFNVEKVLKGGFEMGNIWYNEPKTLDVAFDVIGDVVLSTASQEYGGYTLPRIDTVLAYYAEKSYKKYIERYRRIGLSDERCEEEAIADLEKEFEQGFQGWEYKFNTVGSSRGDYPFISVTIGLDTSRFGKMASKIMLRVHSEGQGKKGFKKPVLFPKIIFLYDKNLHSPGCINEDVFEAGLDCSSKTMYPDWLSLTGEGYVASMYKKYGEVVSPMG